MVLERKNMRNFFGKFINGYNELRKNSYIDRYYFWQRKFFKLKLLVNNKLNRSVFLLLGVPRHGNIGDRSITLAEVKFLKKINQHKSILSLPRNVSVQNLPVRKSAIIILHGGGNFGDTYLHEEEYRRNIIASFPENQIILFPQTIYFENNEELRKSIKIYSVHPNLTLIAREQISFNIMKEHFKKNKVLLTPDIVMSLNLPSHKKRAGLTCVLRNDCEKTISDKEHKIIKDFTDKYFVRQTTWTDMLSTMPKNKIIRKSDYTITINKLREFQRAELVITDRLHGMIFALVTKTPCIVLTNFNHKIKGVFTWIKQAGYDEFIKFTDSPKKIEEVFKTIDFRKNYHYSPETYEAYWSKIQSELSQKTE